MCMKKNITVLVGSPRKNGNTEILADAFIGGAGGAGHSVTKITLRGKKISPCVNCDFCLNERRCAFDDDMTPIYETLIHTDILVFATPVYFYSFPAQLKCVIDRLHNPVRESFTVKGSVLLAVCEDDDDATFLPLSGTYGAIINYLGWKNLGSVLIRGVGKKGSVKGNPDLEKAALLGGSL